MNELHHRIWFGSFLPKAYQLNLLRFKVHNPRYTIHLWTDFQTISEEEKKAFLSFCEHHNFQLKNIREHRNLLNFNLIEEELNTSITDKQRRLVHLVRASDLARISILYEMGGLYLDTDTNSLNSLPVFHSPHNLLLKQLHFSDRIDLALKLDAPKVFCTVFFDFIVAEVHHWFIKFAADIATLDYATYHSSQNRLWEQSLYAKIHLYATVRLTGSSLRFALDHAVAHGNLVATIKQETDLFFDDQKYLDSTYDHSWLKDLSDDKSIPKEISESMEIFRNEIDEAREKRYPHNLPSLPIKGAIPTHSQQIPFADMPRQEPIDYHAMMRKMHAAEQYHISILQQLTAVRGTNGPVFPELINSFIPFAPIEIRGPDINLSQLKIDFTNEHFRSNVIELLNDYLSHIPRRGITHFFQMPEEFDLVSQLVKKIKKERWISSAQIIDALQKITERLPHEKQTSLQSIIEKLNDLEDQLSAEPAISGEAEI